jgi:hypothetical protein
MNSGALKIVAAMLLFFPSPSMADDQLTNRELSEQIPIIISLASETAMFTGFIAAEQSRPHFTREHAAYLLDSTRDEIKKLQKKTPDAASRGAYEECLRSLLLLQSDLKRIAEGTTPSDVQQIHAQARELQQRLHTISTSL